MTLKPGFRYAKHIAIALIATLFTSSIFGANDMTFERKSEGTYCEDAAGLTVDILGTVA